MLKKPDFLQDYSSELATGVYKSGHVSIKLLKWICYFDRSFYENLNYFDLMGSLCRYFIQIT